MAPAVKQCTTDSILLNSILLHVYMTSLCTFLIIVHFFHFNIDRITSIDYSGQLSSKPPIKNTQHKAVDVQQCRWTCSSVNPMPAEDNSLHVFACKFDGRKLMPMALTSSTTKFPVRVMNHVMHPPFRYKHLDTPNHPYTYSK